MFVITVPSIMSYYININNHRGGGRGGESISLNNSNSNSGLFATP